MMNIKAVADELKKFKSILIFTHVRPDGDTLGGALALKLAFTQLGIRAEVINMDSIPHKYWFLSEMQTILRTLPEEKFEAHVSVDCASEQMFGEFKQYYRSNKNTFNIDHHISNEGYAATNYVREEASASEIVFDLIKNLGAQIDKRISDLLLLGIVTDTGNFSQSNTTANSFTVAGELVKNGADVTEINDYMFKRQTKGRATLYADTIAAMKFFCDDRVAVITIRKSALDAHEATPDMTEGFINYTLTVDTVEVGISILEVREKSFKISFRSKGADVNKVAGIFGGGGHKQASGCMINGFYEDVIDKLVFNVGNYL